MYFGFQFQYVRKSNHHQRFQLRKCAEYVRMVVYWKTNQNRSNFRWFSSYFRQSKFSSIRRERLIKSLFLFHSMIWTFSRKDAKGNSSRQSVFRTPSGCSLWQTPKTQINWRKQRWSLFKSIDLVSHSFFPSNYSILIMGADQLGRNPFKSSWKNERFHKFLFGVNAEENENESGAKSFYTKKNKNKNANILILSWVIHFSWNNWGLVHPENSHGQL